MISYFIFKSISVLFISCEFKEIKLNKLQNPNSKIQINYNFRALI
jgi:hypothetical protein